MIKYLKKVYHRFWLNRQIACIKAEQESLNRDIKRHTSLVIQGFYFVTVTGNYYSIWREVHGDFKRVTPIIFNSEDEALLYLEKLNLVRL